MNTFGKTIATSPDMSRKALLNDKHHTCTLISFPLMSVYSCSTYPIGSTYDIFTSIYHKINQMVWVHGLEWHINIYKLHDLWAQPRLRKTTNPGEAMAADSPFRVTTPPSCTASASGNANSPMKVGGRTVGSSAKGF